MTIYYLYVKTHNKTGLKYLGKTTSINPHQYIGSGKDWKSHLKKYGKDFSTTILKECSSNRELSHWGRFYSSLWNVAKSSEWANCIPETGGGPGWQKGRRHSVEFRRARKLSQLGAKNPKFDSTLYWFIHQQNGIREHLTKYEFRRKYNIAHSHVSNLVSGYNYTKSHKGWTVVS